MSGAAAGAGTPPLAYRRQTPTIWQALGRSLWRALEEAGRRRAERALRGLAQRYQAFDAQRAQGLRDAARHDAGSPQEHAR